MSRLAGCWRLLRHGPAAGCWNMGVDEALLGSAGQGQASLRLYQWDGAWLSLGYAQKLGAEPRQACRERGIGVVHRVTGGRAVLHGGDLTYAVAAPLALLPGDVAESYARVAQGLVIGLRSLGVEVECVSAGATPDRTEFDCFATAAAHEIRAAGRKLCGSAQRRGRRALLQHGSIRLRPDPPGVCGAIAIDPGAATSLAELGVSCSPEVVAEALVGGLADTLGVRFQEGALRPEERSAASIRRAEPPRDALLQAQEPFWTAR